MNAFLKKMGYSDSDRVLITHIDDIGFCHASNVASFECLDNGSASCGSILINAPWFQESAGRCRENPNYDVGVHLTLTCEYETFRWPALSSRDPASGLMDEQGYLWRSSREAVKNIPVEAAEAEMRAQIEKALESGIDVTHIDTHMGSVVHPKFLRSYLALAREFEVPAFLPNITRERLSALREDEFADQYIEVMQDVDTGAVPTLDEIIIDTLRPMDDKRAFYEEIIGNIKPGLTHLLFHPARIGEELQAITATSCHSRNADYEAYRDDTLKKLIEASGIKLIGYRELRAHL